MEQAEPRIGSQYIGKWNWGAFLLTGFWLFWHRRVKLAIWFWIFWIAPFIYVVFIATLRQYMSAQVGLWIFMLSRVAFFAWWLWLSISLGRNGNRIATERDFTSEAQFVTVEQRWAAWSFVLWGIWIVLCIAGGFAKSNT